MCNPDKICFARFEFIPTGQSVSWRYTPVTIGHIGLPNHITNSEILTDRFVDVTISKSNIACGCGCVASDRGRHGNCGGGPYRSRGKINGHITGGGAADDKVPAILSNFCRKSGGEVHFAYIVSREIMARCSHKFYLRNGRAFGHFLSESTAFALHVITSSDGNGVGSGGGRSKVFLGDAEVLIGAIVFGVIHFQRRARSFSTSVGIVTRIAKGAVNIH